VRALVIIAVLALAGCGEAVDLDRLAAGPRLKIVAAVSGDTVKTADGTEVRLAGVEAPRAGEAYAEPARALLQGLVAGQEVELAYGGARQDPSGRAVAHVRLTRSRRWLEGELLRAGAARVRTYGDNRALAARMLAAEAEARWAKRGLWAAPAYEVRLPEEITPGMRGLQIVEGRVLRAGEARAIAYLDFAQDWRQGVSVHVPRAALDDFHLAGRHPLDLQGRLVRVRGTIREGRVLWIDHPEALEILRER